jgi:transposase InsO family protein
MRATLITWNRRLGHPAFKTVLALAQSGASGMVIMDVPAAVPSLDSCAACGAAKASHLPHKEGRGPGEYLERVHIEIVGPMPMNSAGGREYAYVVAEDYTRTVYTRPLRLKWEAADAFKTFRAVEENESESRLRAVMTDNARELSIAEVRDICEQDGVKLQTTPPYHPASNEVAELTI